MNEGMKSFHQVVFLALFVLNMETVLSQGRSLKVLKKKNIESARDGNIPSLKVTIETMDGSLSFRYNDVAQSFTRAVESAGNAIRESFHVVSEQALTLRDYATDLVEWFGKEMHLIPCKRYGKQ